MFKFGKKLSAVVLALLTFPAVLVASRKDRVLSPDANCYAAALETAGLLDVLEEKRGVSRDDLPRPVHNVTEKNSACRIELTGGDIHELVRGSRPKDREGRFKPGCAKNLSHEVCGTLQHMVADVIDDLIAIGVAPRGYRHLGVSPQLSSFGLMEADERRLILCFGDEREFHVMFVSPEDYKNHVVRTHVSTVDTPRVVSDSLTLDDIHSTMQGYTCVEIRYAGGEPIPLSNHMHKTSYLHALEFLNGGPISVQNVMGYLGESNDVLDVVPGSLAYCESSHDKHKCAMESLREDGMDDRIVEDIERFIGRDFEVVGKREFSGMEPIPSTDHAAMVHCRINGVDHPQAHIVATKAAGNRAYVVKNYPDATYEMGESMAKTCRYYPNVAEDKACISPKAMKFCLEGRASDLTCTQYVMERPYRFAGRFSTCELAV